MELINLNSSAHHKLSPSIQKMGGRYSFREKIHLKGIGKAGLLYISGIPSLDREIDTKEKLKVTLELYRKGLGLFFRNHDHNFVCLLPTEQLQRFIISKKEDLIVGGNSRFYKMAKSITSDYLVARNFLLENEKHQFHPILCEIERTISDPIVLEIDSIRPQKVIDFIKKIENLQVEVDIKDHKIINAY